MPETKGRLLQRLDLDCDTALELLALAVTYARGLEEAANPSSSTRRTALANLPRYQDDSSYDGSRSDDNSSSGSDESNEECAAERQDRAVITEGALPSVYDAELALSSMNLEHNMARNEHQSRRKQKDQPTMDAKQRQATIIRHVENVPCVTLPYNESNALYFPSCLLSKEDRLSSQLAIAKSALHLAQTLRQDQRYLTILCVRSGRFAGAVYHRGTCLDHTTSQRYTVRRGQGKAQSAQDGNRRPKSMGAQLRRAGEQMLREDIFKTLVRWEQYIQGSALIVVSCPKTMLKDIVDGNALLKTDQRLRRVPLDIGRPSCEAVGIIHAVLTSTTVREYSSPSDNTVSLSPKALPLDVESRQVQSSSNDLEEDLDSAESELELPLSNLHMVARDGVLDSLRALLQSAEATAELVNAPAGEYLMTPLHFAAQSGVSTAPDCVYELLVTGRANPCVVDARNRVPWYLAASDKVREAFRIARADLGEEYCDWDKAKVAAALSEDDVRRRKEAEADKRRKKRARQKQRKAEEKAIEDARAEQQRAEALRLKQEEEAKRIRDGLMAKTNKALNTCDYCQISKPGLKKRDMFQRLDYFYCSTDCVQRHKRELMAAAALKRLES